MDDIDDLLRRAMKSLDDQVTPGYFETLATKTLARLEDDTMETPTSGKSEKSAETEAKPAATTASSSGVPPRDEDSGLHDIRSLASSAKARAAARRSTANMQIPDEDVLANSTGSWKAVALPEPAKMVSLPELAELPSKREVRDAERQHKETKNKEARKAAHLGAEGTKPVEKSEPPIVSSGAAAIPSIAEKTAKPAVAVESVPAASKTERPIASIAAARVSRAEGGGKGKTIAIVAIAGVAAAAAVAFVAMGGKKKEAAPPPAVASREPAPAPVAVAPAPVVPPPAPAPEPPPVVAVAPPPVETAPAADKKAPAKNAGSGHEVKVEVTAAGSTTKTKTPAKGETGKPAAKDGEPSFDDLLKEAGVQDQKAAAPKLEKKSLTGDDFKAGMAAVASKAQSCYAGTQGTATVRLTIAPTGKVSKVAVTGAFADTPVANCVSAAVQGASFPPWDGGPQTFGYSYLLSE